MSRDMDTVETIVLSPFKMVELTTTSRVQLDDEEQELDESPVLETGELRVERDSREELEQTRTAIGDAFKSQREAFDNATDSVYWMCVCFQSRAQLVEWLTKSGLMPEIDGQYIDGRKVAERMGIQIEAPDLKGRTHRIDRRLEELT